MNTINGIGQVAIAILIAAVILGLGGTILSKMQGTQSDASATLANQTVTFINNTAIGLSESRVIISSVIVYNDSVKINKGTNYTVTKGSITFLNASVFEWCGGACLNVSYDYNYGSSARNATESGKIGLGNMSEFIPTIAIVAMAGIVIGIILVFFGRKKDEEVL